MPASLKWNKLWKIKSSDQGVTKTNLTIDMLFRLNILVVIVYTINSTGIDVVLGPVGGCKRMKPVIVLVDRPFFLCSFFQDNKGKKNTEPSVSLFLHI